MYRSPHPHVSATIHYMILSQCSACGVDSARFFFSTRFLIWFLFCNLTPFFPVHAHSVAPISIKQITKKITLFNTNHKCKIRNNIAAIVSPPTDAQHHNHFVPHQTWPIPCGHYRVDICNGMLKFTLHPRRCTHNFLFSIHSAGAYLLKFFSIFFPSSLQILIS